MPRDEGISWSLLNNIVYAKARFGRSLVSRCQHVDSHGYKHLGYSDSCYHQIL
jgi:hypothetical protein